METHSSIHAEQPRPSEEHLKHFYLTCFSAAKCQDVTPVSHQPEQWDNLLQPLLSWERAAELHRCFHVSSAATCSYSHGKTALGWHRGYQLQWHKRMGAVHCGPNPATWPGVNHSGWILLKLIRVKCPKADSDCAFLERPEEDSLWNNLWQLWTKSLFVTEGLQVENAKPEMVRPCVMFALSFKSEVFLQACPKSEFSDLPP